MAEPARAAGAIDAARGGMARRWKSGETAFWLGAILLAVLKLVMVSDLNAVLVYGPHDDSLYVRRAFELLSGNGFGPYDSRTLVKLPGMSLWLALERALGIPHVIAVHALYCAAGMYLLWALRRAGVPAIVALAGCALYLFNPYTLSLEWHRILREPVVTPLLVMLFASAIIVIEAAAAGRAAYGHYVVFSATLGFGMLVREEDVLLLVVLAAVWLFTLMFVLRRDRSPRLAWRGWIALALLPVAFVAGANWSARAFIERHYGAGILHDYGEGEFPRLVAALRSIRTAKDNRYVMVTQAALRQLRTEVPRLAPVIDRLPPPGPGSYSCKWLGVCSEWSTGWLLFWIKDAAYEVGLTPSLPAAQSYFRAVREDVEKACADGRLRCEASGSGLIPPPELRWTRAFARELARIGGMLFPSGFTAIVDDAAPSATGTAVARTFAAVTMSDRLPLIGNGVSPDRERIFREARGLVALAYSAAANLVVALSFAALAVALWRGFAGRQPLAAMAIATVLGYVAIRIVALSYVAVYMGHYEPRMVFAVYAAVLFMAPVMIWALFETRRRPR